MKNYVRVNQSKITTVNRGSNLKTPKPQSQPPNMPNPFRNPSILNPKNRENFGHKSHDHRKMILYHKINATPITFLNKFCFMTRADMK